MSDRLTKQVRQAVTDRANGCCEYCLCQDRFAPEAFSIDHIIPRSRAGSDALDNLAFACIGCNNHKYNKTQGLDPESGKLTPLYHPRQQSWTDHFTWRDDFQQIIGTTPTGRATVTTLQLNRQRVINLRRVLHAMGEHPPG